MSAPSTARAAGIAVVMPMFQAERFVAEALASIFTQTRPAAEIIVVDDGCTDGSVAEVQRMADTRSAENPPVTVVHRANGGAAAARNSGVAVARHTLLAFLDADDIALPHWLASLAGRLDAEPGLSCAIGAQQLFIEADAEEPAWATWPPPPGGIAATNDPVRYAQMALMVRRAAFDSVGGFDETLLLGEDTDLILRMFDARLRVDLAPETVVRRRVHPASLTQDAAAFRRAQFKVLARRIARRRLSQ